MEKLLKTIKVIGNILLTILVVIAIISISIFIQSKVAKDKMPGLGNFKFFSVLSESMKPTFKVNDMIIDKNVDTAKLKSGDIITFKDGQSIVTHRIVKVIGNGSQFVTKGDANKLEDETFVNSKDVISKYLFNLPYMGLVISKIKGPLGLILMWAVFIVVIIDEFFSRKLKKRQRRKNRILRRKEIVEETGKSG